MSPATYRDSTIDDAGLIVQFIAELAEYEKLSHEMVATEDDIRRTLFCENPTVFSMIAEIDGESVGFALGFYNFSTFLARPGIYIEDIFVREKYRNKGVGRGFFKVIAQRAFDEGCGRLEWAVLDWNEPSIEFYKKIGAKAMDEWIPYRMDRAAMEAFVDDHGESGENGRVVG